MNTERKTAEYMGCREGYREQQVLLHLNLVHKIANKIYSNLPSHVIRDDLYGYGIFGLLEAIDRYNPEQGVPFAAYAGIRIKGAIIDGIRKEDWVPVSIRKKAKIIETAYAKLENKIVRNASDEEVARELNISKEELLVWLEQTQVITVLSLDEPISEDEEILLKDSVQDVSSPNPLRTLEEKELKKYLAKSIGELPEKEKTVISLFYYDNLSNKEIARVMELSDSRISQLHTKAIFRLRGKMARLKRNLM